MSNLPKYLLTLPELADISGEPESGIKKSFGNESFINLPGNKTALSPGAVKEFLLNLGMDYSFRVLAHINLRGGIGKTTTTITTATRAVQYGFKTAVLDLDPQGSSSLAFDMAPEEDDPIFYDVWQNPANLLMPSMGMIEENLYLLPSSLENALLDSSLLNPASQKNAVKGVCEILKEEGFDLVLIDCPPSLGAAVISAICAADSVIIPVCSDAFSMKGLQLTLKEITSICDTFTISTPEIRILYNKFDRRINLSGIALNELSSTYGDLLIPVFIRTSTEFAKALAGKETIFASTRKSTARDDFDKYVRYILNLQK